MKNDLFTHTSGDLAYRHRPDHIDEQEWRARVDLAACYRLVAHFGWDDLTNNHISMRVPGRENEFLLNPYGPLFGEITASSLIRVDQEGNKLDDTPYEVNQAGFVIHGAIHAARHDALCVLHGHSDASVAVSAQTPGLLPLSQFAMRFFGRQGFHPYEGVAIDGDERPRIVANLGNQPVLVMRNHGILTVGRTPGEAFMLLYYFERAARIQLTMQAAAAGCPDALAMPPDDVCEKAASQYWQEKGDLWAAGTREWPPLLRKLDTIDDSYQH